MRSDQYLTSELSAAGVQGWPPDAGRAAPPARGRLVRDVLLRDGATLRLQAPTPEDFEDIKAFYDGLSSESLYFRFHGSCRTDVIARAEAEASGVDRLALIGRRDGEVVSVASYEGLREPGVAEVAFAVADRFQRRGIGTRMLEQLAAIAAERGIHRFDAEVMAANRRMLGVFEHAGFTVRREGSFGEVTVSLEITPTEALIGRIDERDHFAAVASLRAALAPSSVAVVGADASPGNVGHRVLANIIAGGFQGLLQAVNPAGGVVHSLPAARTIGELKVAPELVIIAASGDEVLTCAVDAAASGARALLIVPTGSDPNGGISGNREERLLEIVRGAGMRLIGPNSLGVLNTAADVSLNATVSAATVRAGRLAICSQSAAPGIGLLGHASARGLGVSMLASTGDRADVSTNDLLECFEDDDRTAAVMLYVETFGNTEHFTRIAQRVSRTKPILALKGRTSAGPAHSELCSHTAAAFRDEAMLDALLHQAGVLRFRTVEDLFDAAVFFERQPLPRGRRIAIVTNSSAVATLAIDACAARGLEPATPGTAPNPVVLGIDAGPEQYATSSHELLSDPGIDAVMVFYVDLFDDPERVLAAVSAASAAHSKPLVASVVRSDGQLAACSDSGVPNFLFPESCVTVLARAAERHAWLSRPLGERPHYLDLDPLAARELVSSFLDRQPAGGWLALDDARALLATHGIPLIATRRCHQLERAIAVAADIGAPIALKADLAPPAHAGDIDAVLLGLQGHTAIRAGWRELKQRTRTAEREWTGAILQPLAPPGADVLVGAVRDPDLGHVLAAGPGGRQAGLGPSTAFRLLPTTDTEADELIDSSESLLAELSGLRGTAALDHKSLRELILRFAHLLRAAPQIIEADLNVRCATNGCLALNLRLRIEHTRANERIKTW